MKSGRMIGRSLVAVVVGSFLVLFVNDALSHSGGTNAAGCHTNSKTGGYHCHTPKASVPGRSTYCHVINGEYRCGYAQSTCNSLVSRYGGHCVRR